MHDIRKEHFIEISLSEIRYNIKQIVACIDFWKKDSRGPFAWVDDGLIGFIHDKDFCYFLHDCWVSDWNRNGREKPMAVFLRNWITEDHIATVIAQNTKWTNEKIICGTMNKI